MANLEALLSVFLLVYCLQINMKTSDNFMKKVSFMGFVFGCLMVFSTGLNQMTPYIRAVVW